MNKVLVALFVTLSLAVTVSADCSTDMFSALPQLQKMYMDYSSKNWQAVIGGMERFVPTGKLLLTDCAGIDASANPRIDACIEDTMTAAKMIVPVVLNNTNEAAIGKLVVQMPQVLGHLYNFCIKPQSNDTVAVEFMADDEDIEMFDLEDITEQIAKFLRNYFMHRGSQSIDVIKAEVLRFKEVAIAEAHGLFGDLKLASSNITDCFDAVSVMAPIASTLFSDLMSGNVAGIKADIKMISKAAQDAIDVCHFERLDNPPNYGYIEECLVTFTDEMNWVIKFVDEMIADNINMAKVMMNLGTIMQKYANLKNKCDITKF